MKKIIHIDMDCFFAAVERKHDSNLLGLPIAVGGLAKNRGVIATASYEARSFGVKSAMPTSMATRLCPDLILVYPKMHLYKKESAKINQIFKRYTNFIEPLSLDEAFLDVSHSALHSGSATRIAKEIRDTILIETGLTASAGVANNKFLAKVCSDLKKPNGQFTLKPEDNFNFTSMLPVKKIFGVGKKTEEKMKKMNIHTCKDLQSFTLLDLQKNFGSLGTNLFNLCRGKDNRAVNNTQTRKSLSVETTFSQDLTQKAEITHFANKLYLEFIKRFDKSKISPSKIKSVHIKIKNSDFKTRTKEFKNMHKIPSLALSVKSIEDFWSLYPEKTRLLGFGVKFINNQDNQQTSFTF